MPLRAFSKIVSDRFLQGLEQVDQAQPVAVTPLDVRVDGLVIPSNINRSPLNAAQVRELIGRYGIEGLDGYTPEEGEF